MLIQFSVGNYRSFKETVTLSMLAVPRITSKPKSLDENNVFAASDDLNLLSSAAIYGANASGKSNLVLALRFMSRFVIRSSRDLQIDDHINVEPFLLSTETEKLPSFFELVFELEGTQYRYGFEVTSERVVGEWLHALTSSRESKLFIRDHETIQVYLKTFREGRGLEERTRPNALFLSVVAQFNGDTAKRLVGWFGQLVDGLSNSMNTISAWRRLEQPDIKDEIERFIKRLDVGIDGIYLEYPPEEVVQETLFPDEMVGAGDSIRRRRYRAPPQVRTIHQKYDANGQLAGETPFDLQRQESAGTQRLFILAYPILNALRRGTVLVIDELDARVHPNLVIELIRLFNSKETNPNHAQFIFTTHNTNLLSAQIFRRDQIWFVEKSRQGASDLYSLAEYRLGDKGVRNDASYEKDYVAGRYGAIPFIGDLSSILGESDGQETEG